MSTAVISPGATIGVLGSGQLGRMFAIAARRMGYRVHVLSPDTDTPTGQVADLEINAEYKDLDAIQRLAQSCDVLSFEFENIPFETVSMAERFVPVRPAGTILHITQNRWREKSFLQSSGVPVTPFQRVTSLPELESAFGNQLSAPSVLKTSAWGYDGKGQVTVRAQADLPSAWQALQTDDAVLERFVDFACEISVVGARDTRGNSQFFAPFANAHHHHILDISVTPAPIQPKTTAQALEIARTIFEALDLVGVLCVEFFVTQDGNVLVNELAPRPHNSGHLTMDAHITCQFEQQVRSVCGLPLGSPQQLRPAAMANLLGDLWQVRQPDWAAACAHPDVKLHLYGKQHARPGRKMGHLTATAETTDAARQLVIQARSALTNAAQTSATQTSGHSSQ